MDEAILYDLICKKTVDKWRDEIENEEDCLLKKNMFKARDALCEAVEESKRKLVDHYRLAIENYWDYLSIVVDIKLINMCIKIGMEIQKFYDENKE